MRKSLPRINAPLPVEKSKPPTLIDPISVRIAVAVTMTGLSRSRLYELIKSGELEIVNAEWGSGRCSLALHNAGQLSQRRGTTPQFIKKNFSKRVLHNPRRSKGQEIGKMVFWGQPQELSH